MSILSVVHLQGLLLMFLAASMLLPIPFSLFYGDDDYTALLIGAAITVIFGFAFYKIGRVDRDLRAREGFAIVTFGWIFCSFFGALPFLIYGAIPSFTDAFFETMSGFSTTGATILTDIEALPHGLLFWRSLTHWIGGMGIIVFSLAILPFLGVGGMQLFKAEVPGPVADKLTPRVAQTAKILWGVYVLLSAAEVVLLLFGGMSLFDALCHTFGTMATGGYSTLNSSVGGFDSAYIDYVIIIFMLLAGMNFALHYSLLRGDLKAYVRNREFQVYIAIIGVVFLIIGADTFLHQYRNIAETVRYTLFQVVSIQTTTGFGTADYELWSPSSQFLLFLLMFIGGSAGSTAGGMKVMRIYLVIKFVFMEITQLVHPHAVLPVRMGGVVVQREVITNILGFFALFILIFAGGVFTMSLLGLDLLTSLGAVIATMGNIGPGLGNVGPTDNYAFVPPVGKWVLSFLMLLGRLELFTVIVLFSPSYWRK
jgi:trk system potassium uptake protein TrkH